MRHALDLMHIEKNVCDNVICTVLGIAGKTKDDEKARRTYEEQGVRRDQWLQDGEIPDAPYGVKGHERKEVLEHIRAVKFPSGYAGSLKSKVNPDEKKFLGLKTHDCHVLMQRIFPLVIRKYVPPHVAEALTDLGNAFQLLCTREPTKKALKKFGEDIVIQLCKLETIFPPSLCTIMVHLLLHLPDQVMRTGPVHFTWMFPIERYGP